MLESIPAIKETQKRLMKLQKESNSTLLELMQSLAIQEIWPTAFESGGSVALRARAELQSSRDTAPQVIKYAWLAASDGRKFPLTKENVAHLQPTWLISKNFSEKLYGGAS